MELTELDKKIKDTFLRLQTYSGVERELGVPRSRVKRRVLYMRKSGIKLPDPLRGMASLSPDRRLEISRKGVEARKASNGS